MLKCTLSFPQTALDAHLHSKPPLLGVQLVIGHSWFQALFIPLSLSVRRSRLVTPLTVCIRARLMLRFRQIIVQYSQYSMGSLAFAMCFLDDKDNKLSLWSNFSKGWIEDMSSQHVLAPMQTNILVFSACEYQQKSLIGFYNAYYLCAQQAYQNCWSTNEINFKNTIEHFRTSDMTPPICI